MSNLKELRCYNNNLTYIPFMPNLELLYCYNNNLLYDDIDEYPDYPKEPNITLTIDDTQGYIQCGKYAVSLTYLLNEDEDFDQLAETPTGSKEETLDKPLKWVSENKTNEHNF